MRRRLALSSSILAIVLVLVLPATTFAADYTYTIVENNCYSSGGDYGYGSITFEVKQTEHGWSGANKFTFAGKAQHRNIGGRRWYTDWNWGTFTYRFPNNGNNTWYSRWYEYDPGDYAWHRIKVVLKVWNGSWLLAKKTVYSDYC